MEKTMFNFVIVETNNSGEDSIYSRHRSLQTAKSRFKKDFAGTDKESSHQIVNYCDHIRKTTGTNKIEIFNRYGEKIFYGDVSGLRNANLENANLDGKNLENLNFSWANLKGATFQNSNLIKTDFRRANLENASFKFATLTNATLTNSNLKNSDFSNTDLENADLESSNLNNANFEYSNLKFSNLKDTDMIKTKLNYARLYGASMIDASLKLVDLNHVIGIDDNQLTQEQKRKNKKIILPFAIMDTDCNGLESIYARYRTFKFAEAVCTEINYSFHIFEKGSLEGRLVERFRILPYYDYIDFEMDV